MQPSIEYPIYNQFLNRFVVAVHDGQGKSDNKVFLSKAVAISEWSKLVEKSKRDKKAK